ncbi:hypothetical protein Q5P01_025099 [Channa striata]|uniref:AIG1-type G domain-containing protein n=1 Tax=Channa striata TaxID=64152 RepID=A0AA88IQB4_CHASR|nr:hypothetical protein Q5P01_025099 [Channa striata]
MSENLRRSFHGSSPQELRLLLLGNIGCGKTSSADTILGQLSPISPSASRSCQLRHGSFEDRSLTLVEAPRWYWSGGKTEDSVRKETEKGMTMLAPGPHGILLLVPVNQFTEMEGLVPAELEEVFGKESLDHTLVLLTCGDYLMGRTVEEYLHKEHPGLRKVIEQCGGMYHVINNRQRQNRDQVRELLEKVDNMVRKNGLCHIKTDQDREFDEQTKQRKLQFIESREAQTAQKREMVASTHVQDTETLRRASAGDVYRSTLERRRREERDKMEAGVHASQESNGLHSTPAPKPDSYSELQRTPSFRLNADGALLSQMSDTKSNQKMITTFHHRVNSFEEKSPEVSPTSSLHSPVFSSSSPTIAPSSSSYRSSSSPTIAPSSSSYPSSSSPTFAPSSYSYPSSSSPTFAPSSSSYPLSSSPTIAPSSSSYPSSSSPTIAPSSSSYPSSSSPTIAPSSSSYPSSSSPTIAPSSSSYSSSSSPTFLRLVLLGRSGAGKSAAGNIIFGREEFESRSDSLSPITKECEKKRAQVEGRRVAVVDTPDWFNSEHTPDEVRAQISSCVALCSPGPHAFLLCVPLDHNAKAELQALWALESVFGPEAVQKHTIILFTYADKLLASGKAGKDSVEAYIASQRQDLLKLVEKCGDRFHVMETGGGVSERKNVVELLEKVEQTVKEAGGQCYSCPAFQEAEDRVRQRQVEIAKERRGKKTEQERRDDFGQLSSERRALYPYMQPVSEAEEDVKEDEIEKTRDEAEMNVSTMNIQSLPPVTLSSLYPSFLSSIVEKMQSSSKALPKLLSDSSVWVSEGAKQVKSSQVWGAVGSGAQNVQQMVADSSLWEKVGASAGHVSKLVGDRVPQVVVDGSAWVGSGAKAVAASPMWEKVGSGAKLMADSSVRVGAGIGSGAKTLAQSPVWGKVGSGAKMVAESSVWEKIGTTVKQVPKVVIGGALLGLVLGVFLGGVIGGAVGAGAGSAVAEVGRRKYGNKNTLQKTDEAAENVNSMSSTVKQGEKLLKTE